MICVDIDHEGEKIIDGSSHGTEEQATLNAVTCSSGHDSDNVPTNNCIDVQSEESKATQGDYVNLSGKGFIIYIVVK